MCVIGVLMGKTIVDSPSVGSTLIGLESTNSSDQIAPTMSDIFPVYTLENLVLPLKIISGEMNLRRYWEVLPDSERFISSLEYKTMFRVTSESPGERNTNFNLSLFFIGSLL